MKNGNWNKDNVKHVIIAGGRLFINYQLLKLKMNKYLSNYKKDGHTIIIVSGGAEGADKLGEKYAKEKGYRVKQFLPEWDVYGKSAGFKRNEEMAKIADTCVCFWDGFSKGTKHMIEMANKYKLNLRIVKFG